jgi:hypothetical protein
MASRQTDPLAAVLSLYFAFAFFVVLVVLVSPFFLIGAGIVFAYKLYRAYQNSPRRLTRLAHEKSLALYEEASELARNRAFPDAHTFTDELYAKLPDQFAGGPPTQSIIPSLLALSDILYSEERLTSDVIPEPPAVANLIADSRYHDQIGALITKMADPSIVELASAAIAESLLAFVRHLPPTAREAAMAHDPDAPAQFTVSLLETCGNVGTIVEDLALPFYGEKFKTNGLFAGLCQQLDHNLRTMSGLTEHDTDASRLVFAPDHGGTPEEIVSGYLRHTHFTELFKE